MRFYKHNKKVLKQESFPSITDWWYSCSLYESIFVSKFLDILREEAYINSWTPEIVARGFAEHNIKLESSSEVEGSIFSSNVSESQLVGALIEMDKLSNPDIEPHKYEFREMSKNGMECVQKRAFMTRVPLAVGGVIHYHYPFLVDYMYDLTIIKNVTSGEICVDSGCRHFGSLDEAIAHWKPSVEYCDDVGINPGRQSIYKRAVKFLSILENFKVATAKPLSEAKVLSLGAES